MSVTTCVVFFLSGVDVNFPWVSEPNSCAVKHGISPLNEAVALNHTRIALMLIDAGADVNEVDSKGACVCQKSCLQFLLYCKNGGGLVKRLNIRLAYE